MSQYQDESQHFFQEILNVALFVAFSTIRAQVHYDIGARASLVYNRDIGHGTQLSVLLCLGKIATKFTQDGQNQNPMDFIRLGTTSH